MTPEELISKTYVKVYFQKILYGVMVTTNPFAQLSESIPIGFMQGYVVIMILLVIVGTLADIFYKKSARYFFKAWRREQSNRKRRLDPRSLVVVIIQTISFEVLLSGEFCNWRRRISHLLTMYGFFLYVIMTVIMVFPYSTATNPAPIVVPLLWYFGAILVCIGGFWFWFFIRADVVAEGSSPHRVMRADLFIISLLASTVFGLVWAWLQVNGNSLSNLFFVLYLIATTLLFGSVPWSKFAHMFFKPVTALQRRIMEAEGSRVGLPAASDKPKTLGKTKSRPSNY